MSNDDNYFIIYKPLTKNVFISINRVNDGHNEMLITFIYGKSSNGWKLYHMQFGTYSLYGKTAVDYFKIAKRYDSMGHIVDATTALMFAEQTLKPGNQIWQYKMEKEIKDLQKSVMKKINKRYKFPYIVWQIDTKPEIYHIYPRTFSDRYETEIRYFTHINLEDTIALKHENDQLRLVIGDIFKGIDKEKECLIFTATNDYPDGEIRRIKTYGFVQEFQKEQ